MSLKPSRLSRSILHALFLIPTLRSAQLTQLSCTGGLYL